MEIRPSLYLRLGGRARGPLYVEQLRELAAAGTITPATEACADADGPWMPLQALPVRVLLFTDGAPLKMPEFERANLASSPPIDHRDLIVAAHRPMTFGPVDPQLPRPAPASPEHDIHELLKGNLRKEKARGLHKLAPLLRRRSRRRRDYLILLSVIGAVIFGTLLFESVLAVSLQVMAAQMPDQFWPILDLVLFHSPIFAWGLAAFGVYGLALGWVMFVVMDDH